MTQLIMDLSRFVLQKELRAADEQRAALGQRLQREGQEAVAAKNAKFLVDMRLYARAMSDLYGSVTTDDLRLHATALGQYPTHHNCWGSILKGKGWTVIGRQASKLPGNHGRELKVWKWEGI